VHFESDVCALTKYCIVVVIMKLYLWCCQWLQIQLRENS